MLRILWWCAALAVMAGLGLWFGNASRFVTGLEQHRTHVIAHRGVHQIYAGSDRSNEACHAAPVEPVRHGFIENTIPSMREAFRLGADVVEIDVHLTRDGVLAVFHDWTLDCRTDGSGVTHKMTFDMLQGLDVAYRIDDGTQTYPLRGQGVGLMPSLTQVLGSGLDGKVLINFKSRRAEEGRAVAALLRDQKAVGQVYGVYGGSEPTRAAMDATPGLRGFDRGSVKKCLVRYALIGWSGYVPSPCRGTIVLVPQNYARFLWGWPHRFTRRLAAFETDVILAGRYDGSGFASGIDDVEALATVPENFDGYIWTNRIQLVGPRIARQD